MSTKPITIWGAGDIAECVEEFIGQSVDTKDATFNTKPDGLPVVGMKYVVTGLTNVSEHGLELDGRRLFRTSDNVPQGWVASKFVKVQEAGQEIKDLTVQLNQMEAQEPTMVINGRVLSPGQAASVRVAIGGYIMEMRSTGLGDDDRGKAIAQAYLDRLGEVVKIMSDKN